ncbi:LysR family transcriptional regulator [Candidatus Uabimicrobium amorphum]|uniref:LysR family transcriptional regulator n=1 Tax=Uabimicrobium amorphum TaxID=2596890 RepID=A0A5S9ISA1_UABAM|nr:LysR family transcriptional regulator [Candidatus Uabimicrobium amorphum]BBM86501.1 LysR family transcriptional regulator [Candidatus Uabimicrobium amorphum]
MDFDLNLLLCFKVVAQKKSISKAAEVLCITQPAVSTQIKKLEAQLQIQLFERHNRGLVLTQPGRYLLGEVIKWETVLNDAVQETRNLHNGIGGTIRIGTYSTISSHLLPAKIKTFCTQFPQVTFTFEYGTTKEIMQRVSVHELDCAILCDVVPHPNLQQTMFFRDEMLLVAKKSLKYSTKKQNTWNLLSYPHRQEDCFIQVQKHYKSLWKNANVVVESENFETLKQCLLQGLGASFMPHYIIQDKKHTLEMLKMKKRIAIEFFFVTPLSYARKSVMKFREHLITEFSKV